MSAWHVERSDQRSRNLQSRAHGKCNYDNQDEPCEYCALRNLPCEKVRGPKTRRADVSAIPKPQLWNLSPVPTDETLSERERFYLQTAYWRSMGFDGVHSIIYQHLWVHHGFLLPPGPMQYAAMAAVAAGYRLLGEWKVDTCEFLSMFHTSMSRAVYDATISENKLFTLLIVAHTVGLLDDDGRTRYRYLVGILDVAAYVLKKHRSLDGCRLRCLWKTVIATARATDSSLRYMTRNYRSGCNSISSLKIFLTTSKPRIED